MLLYLVYRSEGYKLFQSSPGPKAGCYASVAQPSREGGKFQSSPGPKAGCYVKPRGGPESTIDVSILTRPESRMLLLQTPPLLLATQGFNPHPARKPDATFKPDYGIMRQNMFQSSPGPKAGCYAVPSVVTVADHKFQSSPGPKAGCYLQKMVVSVVPSEGFNPHPARKPDATCTVLRATTGNLSFNPHPARKPDATIISLL